MSLTFNTKTYNLDSASGAKSRYFGPGQSYASPDILDLSRIAPKATRTSNGAARSAARFVRGHSVTLPGATAPTVKIGAIEILTNFPVEVPQAEIEAQLADTIAWLQTQQAKDLILKLTTNFG
jgi:hypothetical protein